MTYNEALEVQLHLIDSMESIVPSFLSYLKGKEPNVDLLLTKDIFTKPLSNGDTYYWSSDFCKLLQSNPANDDSLLTVEDFLSELGFCYFETPIHVVPITEQETWNNFREWMQNIGQRINAFSNDVRAIDLAETQSLQGLRDKVASFHVVDDQLETEFDNWHYAIDGIDIKAISWILSHDRAFIVFWKSHPHQPLPIGLTEIPYGIMLRRIDHEDMYGIRHHVARYAMACILFMNQRIFHVTHERPTRASRRRVSKWRPDPVVKVIRLRRQQQHQQSTYNTPQNWAFQWMVGGHWRNQYYPSINGHKTIWIAPYIKGPPDAPFKQPARKIFSVVR